MFVTDSAMLTAAEDVVLDDVTAGRLAAGDDACAVYEDMLNAVAYDESRGYAAPGTPDFGDTTYAIDDCDYCQTERLCKRIYDTNEVWVLSLCGECLK